MDKGKKDVFKCFRDKKKKHILPGLKGQQRINLILKAALVSQLVDRLWSCEGSAGEDLHRSPPVNFRKPLIHPAQEDRKQTQKQ